MTPTDSPNRIEMSSRAGTVTSPGSSPQRTIPDGDFEAMERMCSSAISRCCHVYAPRAGKRATRQSTEPSSCISEATGASTDSRKESAVGMQRR
jgi:hypothetical protein